MRSGCYGVINREVAGFIKTLYLMGCNGVIMFRSRFRRIEIIAVAEGEALTVGADYQGVDVFFGEKFNAFVIFGIYGVA